MNKLSILTSILAVTSILWHNAPENVKQDGICIYTPNDILYILPNSNTIETESGQTIKFANRDELSEFTATKTAEVVNNAITPNYDMARQYISDNIKLYNLSTDEEIQDLCNNAIKLYELNQFECKLIEEYFYI